MTDEEVREKLKLALDQLYQKDFSLISRKCSERSIVFRLGLYLAKAFEDTDFDVDCEYNKNGDKPKELEGKRFNVPDIIIHRRESNDSNLLIVEVKTPNDVRVDHFEKDRTKLVGFTRDVPYTYQQGIHLFISSKKCCLALYPFGLPDRYYSYSVDSEHHTLRLEDPNNIPQKCAFDKWYDENL